MVEKSELPPHTPWDADSMPDKDLVLFDGGQIQIPVGNTALATALTKRPLLLSEDNFPVNTT